MTNFLLLSLYFKPLRIKLSIAIICTVRGVHWCRTVPQIVLVKFTTCFIIIATCIIITFLQPKVPNFDFKKFYNSLSDKGFLIYPGKLTVADTFRIGCIGHLNEKDMKDAIIAVENTLKDLNIKLS